MVDRPDVSQYRLVAHLGMALIIYGAILWVAMGLLMGAAPAAKPALVRAAARVKAVAALVLLTMLSGGFVAGLDAGYAYNTFPLMDGDLVPTQVFASSPWWLSLFEDVTTVQFMHRVLGDSNPCCSPDLALDARWCADAGFRAASDQPADGVGLGAVLVGRRYTVVPRGSTARRVTSSQRAGTFHTGAVVGLRPFGARQPGRASGRRCSEEGASLNTSSSRTTLDADCTMYLFDHIPCWVCWVGGKCRGRRPVLYWLLDQGL